MRYETYVYFHSATLEHFLIKENMFQNRKIFKVINIYFQ